MADYVLDIETNGLTPDTIWCAVMGQESHRDAGAFNQQLRSLTDEDTIYAHNGIGFDYPVLADLWGCPTRGLSVPGGPALRDTLVLSRLANPSRDNGHSLDAWGQYLGFPKGSHSDWSQFSEDMLAYCRQDVEVTKRVLEVLKHELKDFTGECITLEHEVAHIIKQQERNGWLLDQKHCHLLLAELKERMYELEDEVHQRFKPRYTFVKEVVPKYNKDGSLSVVGLKYLGDACTELCGGVHSRIQLDTFNLGSRQQIGDYLIKFGWKPEEFTPSGQPKVDETTLMNVDIPEAQLIAEYLTVQKRIAQVQSWLDAVGPDGRVHGSVNSNGAVTGRMTHSGPNMAQVPASYSPWGKECRQAWIAPEGYKIVGCDAESLELVMLAHYMQDEGFIKAVSEGNKDDGTDPHTVNQRAAGLDTRDQAKTFIYAFLYGAGDAKIGSIVGGTAADGRVLKQRFLSRTPALARLRDQVEGAAKRGWLRGLDGRCIHVRSTHAALNTLLQGGGAVVMKKALVMLDYHIKARKLDAKFIGNIHDEIQMEVRADHAETVRWLSESCIAAAGKHFNLRCPLRGSAQIGDNWYETH